MFCTQVHSVYVAVSPVPCSPLVPESLNGNSISARRRRNSDNILPCFTKACLKLMDVALQIAASTPDVLATTITHRCRPRFSLIPMYRALISQFYSFSTTAVAAALSESYLFARISRTKVQKLYCSLFPFSTNKELRPHCRYLLTGSQAKSVPQSPVLVKPRLNRLQERAVRTFSLVTSANSVIKYPNPSRRSAIGCPHVVIIEQNLYNHSDALRDPTRQKDLCPINSLSIARLYHDALSYYPDACAFAIGCCKLGTACSRG
jgi:hypothetical protein